jgi:glycosyltransferase involved in cell wall biosynthesis
MVERFEPELKKCSLPLTVRGHGFDFSIELAERLNQNPRVKSFYLFPHFADQCPSVNGKIKPLPVIFNADLYYPSQERDRRLVLRVGCALPSKDYRSFMETALLCPRHRFVLVLCKAHAFEFYADEFIELNKKLGNPVDLRINMQHEDVAHLIRQAGIYMHTVCLDGPHATPIGMPISIAEAMASGCYILGRRCSASAYYIQNAGKLYDTTEEAAALIRETEDWNDRQWQEAARCSIDRAYGNFVSVHVLETIVNDWRKIVGKN